MHDGEPEPLADRILGVLPYLSLLGLLGLTGTILLAFEQPHARLLVGWGMLVASVPVGIGLHLMFNRSLSAEEKRLWVKALTGRNGARFARAYFRPRTRAAATGALLRNGTRGR